jgi:uncharacterized protein (TIGR03083 family)
MGADGEGITMSKPQLNKDFWLGALRAEGDAFRAAVAGATDLSAPVPTCPDWSIAELTGHLANLYNRVRRLITTGSLGRPEDWNTPKPVEPLDEVVSQWTDEYVELLAALDAVDPEQPTWNWAPQAKKAVFWHRRMAHETAVHRWDAQMAATGLAERIEAKLASDGITEVLDTWLPAGRRLTTTDRSGMIALHATDLEQVWYVRLRGAGVALLDTDTLLDSDDRHERATASGSASDVLLALYGRISYDALTVGGDLELLEGLRVG